MVRVAPFFLTHGVYAGVTHECDKETDGRTDGHSRNIMPRFTTLHDHKLQRKGCEADWYGQCTLVRRRWRTAHACDQKRGGRCWYRLLCTALRGIWFNMLTCSIYRPQTPTQVTSNTQHLLHDLLCPQREQHYYLRERRLTVTKFQIMLHPLKTKTFWFECYIGI